MTSLAKKRRSSSRPARPGKKGCPRARRVADPVETTRRGGADGDDRLAGAGPQAETGHERTAAMPAAAETFTTPDGRTFRLHPLARLWPLMTAAEYLALKDAIRRADGNRDPILIMPEDEVLDGRHRLAACIDNGLEPKLEVCEDAASYLDRVLDANQHRRHLSPSQRAMVAARLATLQPGRPGGTAQIQAISQEGAAERFGISRSLVQAARKVADAGVEELIRMVERDEVSVSAAAVIAGLDRLEQRQLVLDGVESIQRRVAALRRREAGRGADDPTRRVESDSMDERLPLTARPDDHVPPRPPAGDVGDSPADARHELGAGEEADDTPSRPGSPADREMPGNRERPSDPEKPTDVEVHEVGGRERADGPVGAASAPLAADQPGNDREGGDDPHQRASREDSPTLGRQPTTGSALEIVEMFLRECRPALDRIRPMVAESPAFQLARKAGLNFEASYTSILIRLLDTPVGHGLTPCAACGGRGGEGSALCFGCDGDGVRDVPADV